MNGRIVSWSAMQPGGAALFKAGNGRRPVGLEIMLRTCFVQQRRQMQPDFRSWHLHLSSSFEDRDDVVQNFLKYFTRQRFHELRSSVFQIQHANLMAQHYAL